MGTGVAEPLFERGLALYRRGDLAGAEDCLARLLETAPDHFDALHLQGLIAGRLDELERAVRLIQKAIELRPDTAQAYASRGLIQLRLRRPRAALEDFDRALHLGIDAAALHAYRGSALIDLGRPLEAAESCARAIALRDDFAQAHLNRAAALYMTGRHTEALAHCDRAIALQSGLGDAHAHRGAALHALHRPAEALESLERALAVQPHSAFAHNLCGLCWLDLQRPQQALASCERALAIAPDLADAHNSRGLALANLRLPDAALASFDAAIARAPGVAEPHFNKGICHLQSGDFERGWELYERRPLRAGLQGPLWDGSQDVVGRTLFVYCEQGLGDTLQFCRYAQLLAQRGARVILAVQDGLRALVRSLGCGIVVVGREEPVPQFDYHCPLLSLPRAFRTRLGTIPAKVPYLAVDPPRIRRWRARLGAPARCVGIRWQGSTGRADAGRSFPLRHFEVLAQVPGIRLVSLQKGAGSEQLAARPAHRHIEDLGDDFEPDGPDAFLDVAALMQCLDLVITSDTSIAHLAGALACPAWVALKHVPDWRWMLDREDSPWYPTLRLFRQTQPGDWDGVFEHMRDALQAAAPSAPATA